MARPAVPGTWKQAGPSPGRSCSPTLGPRKAVPRGWINESWGPIWRCRWGGVTLPPLGRGPTRQGRRAPEALTLEMLSSASPSRLCLPSSLFRLEAVKVAGALPASLCSQTASLPPPPTSRLLAISTSQVGAQDARPLTRQTGRPLSCRGGRLPLPLGSRMFPRLLHPPPHPPNSEML